MILDADVLIDLYRRRPAAQGWFASLTDIPLLAGLAAMELMEGAANRHEMRNVRRFLFPFILSWPTEADMVRAHTSYQPLRLAHGIESSGVSEIGCRRRYTCIINIAARGTKPKAAL